MTLASFLAASTSAGVIATGAGASVRTNGEAAWVNRGSTGASAGGAGWGSLTAPGWYPPRGGFKPTLVVLVLARVVRLVGVAVAVIGVLRLRLAVVLGALVVLLVGLLDGCCLRGPEPVNHDPIQASGTLMCQALNIE